MAGDRTRTSEPAKDEPVLIGDYRVIKFFRQDNERTTALADDKHGNTVVLKGARNVIMGRELLQHEAEILDFLNHVEGMPNPHIVHLVEQPFYTSPEGAPFLVTVYAGGDTLDKLYLDRKFKDDKRYLGVILTHAADALAFVHKYGLVHLDINLGAIVGNGEGTVIDFESAVMYRGGSTHPLRRRDEQLLTRRFVSPEIWMGERPTPKSDIYSYCVMAWLALNALGEEDDTPYAPRTKITAQDDPRRSELVAPFHFIQARPLFEGGQFRRFHDFGELVNQGMEVDPRKRPTAKELYEAGCAEFGSEVPPEYRIPSIDRTVKLPSSCTSPVVPYTAGTGYARETGPTLESRVSRVESA